MSKIRVLIADDVAETRKDIQRLLYFENDIKVVGEAGDGKEAIQMVEKYAPDVVLMDINMPVMDGIVATEKISFKYPGTAIMIVSIQGEYEYLRKAMKAGAREYLVKPLGSEALTRAIRQVYNMKQRRRDTANGEQKFPQKGRMVTIFAPQGGVGKTTLAVNLAVELAGQNKKVVLVDLDLQFGDVGVFLNLNNEASILELFQGEGEMENKLHSNLVSHSSGVKVLLAPPAPQDAELVTGKDVMSVLDLLRKNFDYVVVDTGMGYGDLNLQVLESSEDIIVPFSRDLAGAKNVRMFLEIMSSLGYIYKVELILVKSDLGKDLNIKDLEESLGLGLKMCCSYDPAAITAINQGKPLSKIKESPLSSQIRELAGSLETPAKEKQQFPKKKLLGKLIPL